MRIAMVAAEFTADEANGLRRAMATFRNIGTIQQFREMMVGRMVGRGYEPAFAEACFKQIEGFGSYGFPESHAASFALLVYVSAWLKCHHPAVVRRGVAQLPAHGILCPGPDRPRCPRTWCGCAAGGCERLGLGYAARAWKRGRCVWGCA